MKLGEDLEKIEKKLRNPKVERLVLAIIIGYFVLRGLEFTFTILPFIGPDERYHIDLATLFSQKWGMVQVRDLGDVGFILPPKYIPYLYHLLSGNLLKLNFFEMPNYQFLRLVSLATSTITVVVSYKAFKNVFKNTILSLFAIAILTNIPFFSFISAAVSYDSLTNLLAAIAIYFFILILDKAELDKILTTLIVLFLGTLTKLTFVPLALLLLIPTALNIRGNLSSLKKHFFEIDTKRMALVIVLVLVTIFNIKLYVGNIAMFGRPEPKCQQVMSPERCSTTKREEMFFKPENISQDSSRVGIVYYSAYWFMRVSASVMHHGGHKYLWLPPQIITFFVTAFATLSILTVTRFKRMNKLEKYFLVISSLYILSLIFYVYAFRYLPAGFMYKAINGRYLFPIIIPLIVLFVNTMRKYLGKYFVQIAIATVLLFVLSDYIYFKAGITVEWTTDWYNLQEVREGKVGPLDYLDSNIHTGEPYGWQGK